MTRPPVLTDRSALMWHRKRASAGRDFFLFDEVAFEIEERLKDVNRTFSSPAVVTGTTALAGLVDAAKVVPDEDRLDLGPAEHDAVLHLMALHWADDPIGQIVQARLALKPDGLFLAAMFGGGTLNELRTSLAQAESDLTGGLSPRVALMADIRDLGGLLHRAGLALPVADTRRLRVSYSDLASLIHDLRAMGETNALHQRLRHFSRRALFQRAEEIYREHFSEDEKLIATFEIVFLSGWAPGPDQPRPLRPSSATIRLADALGTPEISLPKDERSR